MYTQDVHKSRRRRLGSSGSASARAASDAGASLRKLTSEKTRLNDAVRALGEEAQALSSEASLVVDAKRDLAAALAQRDALPRV